MARTLTVAAENNIERRCAGRLEALADERDTLVDRTIDYRIVIGEQKHMIRSMLEFTRLMMVHARETMARADLILDRNAGQATGLDRRVRRIR